MTQETTSVKVLEPQEVQTRARLEWVALSSLQEWPGNPRDHDVEAIMESIMRFGYLEFGRLDDVSLRLLAGHGRKRALERIQEKYRGEGHPPPLNILEKDGEWYVPVVRGHGFPDPTEAEAFLLGANATQERGGYKQDLLVKMAKRVEGTRLGLRGTGLTQELVKGALSRSQKTAQAVSKRVQRDKQEERAGQEMPSSQENTPNPPVSHDLSQQLSTGELKVLMLYLEADQHRLITEKLRKLCIEKGYKDLAQALFEVVSSY